MKKMFKNPSKFFLIIIGVIILVFLGKSFDNLYFSKENKGNSSLAAVPMTWDLGRVRSEIKKFEQRYENYFFSGKDPNSSFMKRQEAAMEALRARQYDLEAVDSLGYSLDTYNPKDYRLENFVSSGNPTQNVFYDPKVKATESSNLQKLNTLLGQQNPQNQQELPWGEQIHHDGVPFGGLVVARIECDCEGPQKYTVFMMEFTEKTLKKLKVDIPYTKFYLFYDLQPGQYGLGTYDMGGTCYSRQIDPQCRTPLIVDGVINHGPGVGSSGVMGPSFNMINF